MEEKIKISIVIPIYKAEKYIRNTLESILSQKLKEIRLICIIDASPDNSEKIVQEYISKDKRIILLKNETNMGVSKTRNKGLEYIFTNLKTTEYISFVDADDCLESNIAYEKAYSEAEKYKVDLLTYNFRPSTGWEYVTIPSKIPLMYEGDCFKALFDFPEFYIHIVCWSKLYKKDLLTNIRFEDVNFFEDGAFAYKVLLNAKKLRVIPDVFYCYNIQNDNSCCKNTNLQARLKGIINVLKSTVLYLKEVKFYDKYLIQFINHTLIYTSMVCTDILGECSVSTFNELYQVNIKDNDIFSKLSENVQKIVNNMK